MHVGGWVKLADLKLRFGVSAKTTNCPVHDVTGDALDAIDKVNVLLLVEWTIIDLPIANIRVVKSLLDVGEIIGSVLENTCGRIKLERVRRSPAPSRERTGKTGRHINPARAIIVVPLAPGHG